MNWWSVFVEACGGDAALVTDEKLGRLVNALVPHSGIVSGGGGHASWGARVSVEAATVTDGVAQAVDIVTRLAAETGLPVWPIARAEAVRDDILDAELSRPAE